MKIEKSVRAIMHPCFELHGNYIILLWYLTRNIYQLNLTANINYRYKPQLIICIPLLNVLWWLIMLILHACECLRTFRMNLVFYNKGSSYNCILRTNLEGSAIILKEISDFIEALNQTMEYFTFVWTELVSANCCFTRKNMSVAYY